MRDYATEVKKRVEFIKEVWASTGAKGIVYGNSGGKDSLLVGILCKMACENTVGIIMPCGSIRNYEKDKTDAEMIAKQYNIASKTIDLTDVRDKLLQAVRESSAITEASVSNMAPRLRMTALYAVAAAEGMLVAGTGNRSELYMGYFTKWGDGACDFNPISDLTVTEIYEFLRYLNAPDFIFDKAPSAGLFDGQTDEEEMGVTYRSIDEYLLSGNTNEKDKTIIDKYHKLSEHKRKMPLVFEP